MTVADKVENVALLLDFQNVHLVGRGLYRPGLKAHQCVPDPRRIADIIEARRARSSRVSTIRVHRGRPDPNLQAVLAATNDAQTAEWERDRRVQVIRRSLTYRQGQVIEKGIDVAIAVDLIYLALRRRYDALVLFSGDTDLMPAIEMIKHLRLTHIEVASWRGAKPLRLPGTSLPYCHYLGPADWERTTRDWTSRINQKAPPVPEDGGE
jgi:uncharacterized LabA/DUF88 family protein